MSRRCSSGTPKADATDRQIDALVYELYGLTDEEIAVVDAGVADVNRCAFLVSRAMERQDAWQAVMPSGWLWMSWQKRLQRLHGAKGWPSRSVINAATPTNSSN